MVIRIEEFAVFRSTDSTSEVRKELQWRIEANELLRATREGRLVKSIDEEL
jgi:hypothetical protein